MSTDPESKLKLMVVDDEPDNLDLLYRTFRRNFEVYKAESGFGALDLLEREGEMAIIISDQRMPRMNGTEFLSRTVESFPDTIRIVLTGYTDVEDLVEAINSGKVFKYITKPWNPEELKRVVQQAGETYQVLKQRTNELNRALRRESLFNAVMTAIRESLDYRSMLQTIAETLGKTFAAEQAILCPVEDDRILSDIFYYSRDSANTLEKAADKLPDQPLLQAALEHRQVQLHLANNGSAIGAQLVVPLIYQQDLLALLSLNRQEANQDWSDSDIALIKEVAEQTALAISQAKLYQRIQEQTQQMQAELEVARQIQSNLLHQSWPQFETVNVQACCHPARAVGGDFFEIYTHPHGDIWLAVGDVSGKGVPAALFMASALSVLRRELAQEVSPEPDVVMHNLNSSLSDDLVSNNCFITMVLARYSPKSKHLVYANAGHIYPLVWSHTAVMAQAQLSHSPVFDQAPPEPTYLKVRGVPLGILPTWKASAGSITLNSGDVVLLASDGITEATVAHASSPAAPSSASMLQQSGLWQLILRQPAPLDLEKILGHIQAHNPVQEDDQTILALEVL